MARTSTPLAGGKSCALEEHVATAGTRRAADYVLLLAPSLTVAAASVALQASALLIGKDQRGGVGAVTLAWSVPPVGWPTTPL